MKRPPNEDADLGGPYNENKAMGQVSKLISQDREQSGNLADSSDPVHDGEKPFRITHE